MRSLPLPALIPSQPAPPPGTALRGGESSPGEQFRDRRSAGRGAARSPSSPGSRAASPPLAESLRRWLFASKFTWAKHPMSRLFPPRHPQSLPPPAAARGSAVGGVTYATRGQGLTAGCQRDGVEALMVVGSVCPQTADRTKELKYKTIFFKY